MSTHKRKYDDDAEPDVSAKQRRKRASSEPLMSQTEEPEKREALKRLFGRFCSVNAQNKSTQNDAEVSEQTSASKKKTEVNDESEVFDENEVIDENEVFDDKDFIDENEDPLISDVPVNLDPEQLGFLVCAQETLRFLYGRGFTAKNPMFVRLRSRLIRGMNEIAAA